GRGVAAVFPEPTADEKEKEKREPTPTREAGVPRRSDDTLSEKVIEVGDKDVSESKPARRGKKASASEITQPKIAAAKEAAPTEATDAATEATRMPRERDDEGAAAPKPMIVEPIAQKKLELVAPPAPKPDFIPAKGGYHLPELSLLDYQEPAA